MSQMESTSPYFISWDVGGWSCDKNRKSREALAIFDAERHKVGNPWLKNLRKSSSSFEHLANSSEHLNFEQSKLWWLFSDSEWLSLQTQAGLLGRDTDTLRNSYINPMLMDGRLQAKVPDKPNHPGQAYRRTTS